MQAELRERQRERVRERETAAERERESPLPSNLNTRLRMCTVARGLLLLTLTNPDNYSQILENQQGEVDPNLKSRSFT